MWDRVKGFRADACPPLEKLALLYRRQCTVPPSSEVYVCRRPTGELVACKWLREPGSDHELEMLQTVDGAAGCCVPEQVFRPGGDEDGVVLVFPRLTANRPETSGERAAYTDGLLAALDACHGRGVIHGDVKPANVLYDRASGDVWLIDFGSARRADVEEDADFVGTRGYSPPEGGRSVSGDTYAAGVILAGLLAPTIVNVDRWPYLDVVKAVEDLGAEDVADGADRDVLLPVARGLLGVSGPRWTVDEARAQLAGAVTRDDL